MTEKTVYRWVVVGAGPAGITAVGLLLDAGISSNEIIWIDPEFCAGDFGRWWGEVNSNTRVALFQDYLNGVASFDYAKKPQKFALDDFSRDQFTLLKHVTEPLLWVSDRLREKVITKKTRVHGLSIQKGAWQLQTDAGDIAANKVILATGSAAKSLHFPGTPEIDLISALTPTQLIKCCDKNDTIAVFGSSHSAMIVIRHLVECGVKKIVNFYQSPFCYAVLMDDWILYDDTGLKGETAKWVREHVTKNPLPQIERHLSTSEHIDTYLPNCDKVIYAVGFDRRQLPVTGVSLSHYDETNGIIAPGLFGAGIAFPIAVTDPFGRIERNVGLWKFLKNMKRTLPVWLKYDL
ncbi:MAG TPA: FAD-dependent oxidoreductase [Coxiellaceae bacterium]|nr:FAD-dependent oxidoreductase [Coxiellaceae bacterium]